MICRFVFSGAGGQGIITSAILLAETAVYFDRLNAVQTQSYGPEARGGAARADIIISSEQINFPKVLQPNVLVCLNQESYDKYNAIVRPGGVILLDSGLVRQKKNVAARQVEFP
jgi:2-oxoglutarate ferredoxin oxidoreductase subunit gamma